LAYNSDDESIEVLLDETDGLKEPTGLFYDEATVTLYIANSAAGEVLSYSSQNQVSNPELTLSFTGA